MVAISINRYLARFLRHQGQARDLWSLFPEASKGEIEDLLKAQEISMTSPERLWGLSRAVSYLTANQIPGDFVECGVWRGGSSFLMAQTLARLGRFERNIWMFDTYEGMVPPSRFDKANDGRTASSILKAEEGSKAGSIVWAVSPFEEVEANMSRSGYPKGQIHLVKGDVRDTLSNSAPREVALARLDTDWYESTRHELEVLMPRMVKGGVVIVDDYGHWSGSRKAVDEWVAANDWKPLAHRLDYTGRIWTVPF